METLISKSGDPGNPGWEDRLNLVPFGGLLLSTDSLHLKHLSAFIPELVGKVVLVPGFANFPEAMWLACAGARVTGVDASGVGCHQYQKRWLARRETAVGTLNICHDDIRNYLSSLADASFHAVVCELLIHIFSPTQQAHLLREFQRVIAPGGLIIITALAYGDRNYPRCPDLVVTNELKATMSPEGWMLVESREYEEGGPHDHANGERHEFPHRIALCIARKQSSPQGHSRAALAANKVRLPTHFYGNIDGCDSA
jgi:SAM-dependent methyltransferase